MTCIVGLVARDGVYVGADSAGCAGHVSTERRDGKIFRVRRDWVVAFAGDFRYGQLLRHRMKWPAPPSRGLDRFMVVDFVDALRETLEAAGAKGSNNGVDAAGEGGTAIIATQGRMFVMYSDFQVEESHDDYNAVGSGCEVALGALHASRGVSPRARVQRALRASAHHCGTVRPPFRVMRLEHP